LSRFPSPNPYHMDDALADRWKKLFAIREEINQTLEEARRKKQIGSSLEAEVVIKASRKQLALLKEYESFLPALFIVSKVGMEEGSDEATEEMSVVIKKAPGEKCERCWNYQTTVGENPNHPTLCKRCSNVLDQ
ncbi:MAG: isoleucine--tRNA ligase, partial [Proteobacteria bacterium]|nr:isoleucine--tRNA ligase [Pseudomonadota bacterium]